MEIKIDWAQLAYELGSANPQDNCEIGSTEFAKSFGRNSRQNIYY